MTSPILPSNNIIITKSFVFLLFLLPQEVCYGWLYLLLKLFFFSLNFACLEVLYYSPVDIE